MISQVLSAVDIYIEFGYNILEGIFEIDLHDKAASENYPSLIQFFEATKDDFIEELQKSLEEITLSRGNDARTVKTKNSME